MTNLNKTQKKRLLELCEDAALNANKTFDNKSVGILINFLCGLIPWYQFCVEFLADKILYDESPIKFSKNLENFGKSLTMAKANPIDYLYNYLKEKKDDI